MKTLAVLVVVGITYDHCSDVSLPCPGVLTTHLVHNSLRTVQVRSQCPVSTRRTELEVAAPYASCLIYARALLEYVIFIRWVRSFSKMLPSVKFAEDTVLVSLFSVKNAKIVQV